MSDILSHQSHFATVPAVRVPRTRFVRDPRHLTTFTAGRLVPLYCTEIMAGDTVSMDTSFVIRMSTPLFPTMDNSYFDYFWFFVPSRLVWSHFRNFMGENTESAWTPQTEYMIPQLKTTSEAFNKGSVADYLGLPINVHGLSISALPFRAYTLIWNEWFRDQNTQDPAYFTLGDETTYAASFNPSEDIKNGTVVNYNTAYKGGCLLPLNKYRDYFTSMLPQPQKGEPVSIPVVSGSNSFVYPAAEANAFRDEINSLIASGVAQNRFTASIGQSDEIQDTTQTYNIGVNDNGNVLAANFGSSPSVNGPGAVFDNMAVMNEFIGTTINDFRQAFAIQRLLERDARSGSRYSELLQSHFGTRPIDAVIQRPQYISGKSVPINIDQVVQTSQSSEVSPQGNTAAFSLTGNVSSDFTQSFSEPGYLFMVGGIRTDHTYQQGIERMWTRKRRFDFYYPTLAFLGEQPVLAQELVATGIPERDEMAIGYLPAWSDYRFQPSHITGAFRSNVEGSLDSWHYGDYFNPSEQPILSADFISETSSNIDRTLAVQSELEDQFIADFKFNATFVRPMPLHSDPGLIDHF